jgi:hypothetical protein
VYLCGWITGMLSKKSTDVVMIFLGNANVMVFLGCHTHHFALMLLVSVNSCADTTKASFTTFNLS